MDLKTLELALEKARGMHFHIAHPNELLDDNKLNEYYDGLTMQPDSLLHNVMRIQQFMRNRKIIHFRTAINKTDWQTHSIVTAVNAYNSLMENSVRMLILYRLFFRKDSEGLQNIDFIHFGFCILVELPAAVLQAPFFVDDR